MVWSKEQEKVKQAYEKAREFMYRNARPLDLARWKYHFEGGSAEEVLNCLKVYQNPDGGFGHALEADSFNPNSSPIQTWAATEILWEIHCEHKDSDIIAGILRYLEECKDYQKGRWLAEIPSNNDFPHAPWWDYKADTVYEEWGYNPTICLTGFILKFAEKDSKLYQRAEEIAHHALADRNCGEEIKSGNELACMIRFAEYIRSAGLSEQFSIQKVEECCGRRIDALLCKDTSKWVEYVDRPSNYIVSRDSLYYNQNKDLCEFEARYLLDTQLEDGSFLIPWKWSRYPEEWAVAKNWWKGERTLLYMRYIKAFSKAE
ncbi:MAG: hypothetical protein E7256_15435 [Lachnospiraceae bacterium]|nr:hypothetical protein [Lachnospiraceae bacterium]